MDANRDRAGKGPADQIFERICEHRERPIPAADLAREVGYSKRQLRRICSDGTGQTPGRLDRRLRMDRAKVLLSEGKMSVKEIACEVGYNSVQGFCRAFRRNTEMAASEFAKSNPNLSPLLPGNLVALGIPFPDGQYEVGVVASDGTITTGTFDSGLAVRMQYPDGHFEPSIPDKDSLVGLRPLDRRCEISTGGGEQRGASHGIPVDPTYPYTHMYAGP